MANKKEPKEAIDTAVEGLEPTATQQTQDPAEQAAEAIGPEESQQEDNQSLGETQPADPILDLEQIGSDLLDEHQDRDEVYITSDWQAFFERHHAVNHAAHLHNKRVLTIGRTSTK